MLEKPAFVVASPSEVKHKSLSSSIQMIFNITYLKERFSSLYSMMKFDLSDSRERERENKRLS